MEEELEKKLKRRVFINECKLFINECKLYGLLTLLGGALLWGGHGVFTGEWTFKQYDEAFEQKVLRSKIYWGYHRLLDNYFSPTSTKQDTFNFYSEKGLGHRIKFEEPSFEEKERALEGRVE